MQRLIKQGKQGFSMIELLVVLLIIGILAAVAAPMFIGNTAKARVSEAAAGAGSIRSAERTYFSQNASYEPVAGGATAETYFGSGTAATEGSVLNVSIHGNKYFSPEAYSVVTTTPTWAATTLPAGVSSAPLDFVITVTGSASAGLAGVTCAGGTDATDGAASCNEVDGSTGGTGYIVQMDNSGQVIYTDGTTPVVWNKF